MAYLPETVTWEAGIYQLELTDPVVGGPPNPGTGAGKSNIPLFQLANRSRWLKAKVDDLMAGSALGVTSAQFDNDQTFATTEFVQRALGNRNGSAIHATAAPYVLTAAWAGMHLHLTGAAGLAQAATLPDGTGLPAGATYTISRVTSTGTATISTSGGQTIETGLSAATSVTLAGGDTAAFIWGGAGWLMSGPALQRIAGMASTLADTGVERMPNGRIAQWGKTAAIAQGSNQLITFQLAFPAEVFVALATPIATSDSTNSYSVATRAVTLANMRVTNNSGSSGIVTAYWFAIGK